MIILVLEHFWLTFVFLWEFQSGFSFLLLMSALYTLVLCTLDFCTVSCPQIVVCNTLQIPVEVFVTVFCCFFFVCFLHSSLNVSILNINYHPVLCLVVITTVGFFSLLAHFKLLFCLDPVQVQNGLFFFHRQLSDIFCLLKICRSSVCVTCLLQAVCSSNVFN